MDLECHERHAILQMYGMSEMCKSCQLVEWSGTSWAAWEGVWFVPHITLQAGPFSISSQSTSWQLSVKSANYEQNSQLSEHALSETIFQWCGAVCWHVNWCLWPSKLGGHRILLDNIDFDTVLILIVTLYSTCIWLFLSDEGPMPAVKATNRGP